MSQIKFELCDYYDVLNLYKIIMEAKFNPHPKNDEISRSPFTAKFCSKLVDLLSDYELELKGKERWSEWRKLCNRSDYKMQIVFLVKNYEQWNKLNTDEKKDIMRIYLSPFLYSEEEINELIYDIDNNNYNM